MKTPVIDALRLAVDDGLYTELEQFMQKDRVKERAELDRETTPPDSLNLDRGTRRKVEDWAADVFAAGAEHGFRDGFRVAARLMLESLYPQRIQRRRKEVQHGKKKKAL